ncbi:hypothetical protein Y032_0011g1524 [Ancylostoma ceylanicum]|uniref:Uncharacterized protein n=1 Tax=Ancylostoma ceylanicum TaxID=53326 RepID=A0A016VF78_9BILA|nr:hypothetical protein Y032_0011g1524 [Ancylostoma ceylanicum]
MSVQFPILKESLPLLALILYIVASYSSPRLLLLYTCIHQWLSLRRNRFSICTEETVILVTENVNPMFCSAIGHTVSSSSSSGRTERNRDIAIPILTAANMLEANTPVLV